MNLTSLTEIKELLESAGAHPKKQYGQNFLINKGVLEKIVESADIKKDDVVLEVGPGLGVLTKEIAKKAKKVFVVEKDRDMIKVLEKVLDKEKIKNVEIFNEDVLNLDLEKVGIGNYKLVANIPYYLTSALIRKFLEEKKKPEKIILMIQKEVAQRICKKRKMSLLSLSVQFYSDPKILFKVLKGSFFPSPKIDSAVIEIIPKTKIQKEEKYFFKFIKAGFSSPRKQLLSNLLKNTDLHIFLDKDLSREYLESIFKKINLDKKIRAEDLKESDWINLINEITKNLSPQDSL